MKESFEDEENWQDGQYSGQTEQVRNFLAGLSSIGAYPITD